MNQCTLYKQDLENLGEFKKNTINFGKCATVNI
uniref:Uncharacterized protein n=1 Tax=Anguilla anguilla TaxID=7936 RepID=A0A0E9VN89_ANGAN